MAETPEEKQAKAEKKAVENFNENFNVDVINPDRRIEVLTMNVKDINFDFKNPRKPISKKKKDELHESIVTLGDFGLIVVDENNSVIAGNQRVKIIKEELPGQEVLCKKLIGYSVSEKRAINIKDNTHAGDWDLDLLNDWTSSMIVDLGVDVQTPDPNDRKINEMELIRYEKYDYVVVATNNEIDYNNLLRILGLDGKKSMITNKRGIKARAIWYHDIQDQIIEKPIKK